MHVEWITIQRAAPPKQTAKHVQKSQHTSHTHHRVFSCPTLLPASRKTITKVPNPELAKWANFLSSYFFRQASSMLPQSLPMVFT